MNRILLASHGPLAQAMKVTAEFLMGENENVKSMCAYVDEGSKDLPKMVDCWLEEWQPEDSWTVITDIFGGSVNNEFLARTAEHDFFLLSGMSLPLVLSIWGEEEPLSRMKMEKLLDEAKSTIQLCNGLLEEKAGASEEDF